MKEEKVWAVLGIEPTTDTDIIREAYRAKLVETNPEDNQEGFMQLKEAYDAALDLAESKEDEEPERPYQDIISQIDEVYKDIKKRCDENYWKPILSQPVFTSLDDQDSLRIEFLRYTMDHYKYPGNILRMLDNVFTITQDEAALSEVFPPDFISFLCDNIINDGDYILSEIPVVGRANGVKTVNDVIIDFEGELNDKAEFEYPVDEYISTLNRLVTSYRHLGSPDLTEENRPAEIADLAETILQARDYDFYHPFEEIAVIRYLYYTERYDECFELIKDRIDATLMTGEEHSDFYYTHLVFMYLRFFVQNIHKDMNLTLPADVFEKCEAVLPTTMNEIYVNETHPAWSLVSYLKGEKRRAAEYMSYASEYIRDKAYEEISDQIDSERLEELPGLIESGTDNYRDKISLAWILSRKERQDEALQILENISDENKEDMEYCNIMGRLLMEQNNFSEAIPYLSKWNELLSASFGYDQNLDKNELPIEDVRQITRVPYSYYLLSAAYLNSGDMENAKQNIKLALQGAPIRDYYTFADLYNYILHSNKEYDEGLDFWTREIEKNNPYIAICRGNRQFMAHMSDNARYVIDDYFFLRDNDPAYIDSYVFAEDVYVDYNDREGFETCLKYIERAGVQDVRLDYNLGRYYRTINEPAKAVEIFSKVEDAIKEGYNGIEDQFRFYVSYGYALMDYDRSGVSEEKHEEITAKLKELIETGHELYPDNIRIYWLDTDFNERYSDDADSVYQKMLELFPDDPDVNYEYGRYLDNNDREEEAGEQYKIGFEKNPDHIGIRYGLSDYYNDYLYKHKELPEYNKEALQISSKITELQYDTRAAVHYALQLMDGMHYDEALKFCEKAVEDFPDAPYVRNALGLAYMYMKRFDESEACFKKAIELYEGTNRFASYTNLVKLYQIQCKYEEALEIYKQYTEKFGITDIPSFEKYGELYEDLNRFDEALEARKTAFLKKLVKITGNKDDYSSEINLCKISEAHSDMPAYIFGELVYYIRRYAETLSGMERVDEINAIAEDIRKYMDMAESCKPVEEMTDDYRSTMRYAAWAAGNYFVYTVRSPQDAFKYFKQYMVILKKDDNDEKSYYEDLSEAYDLMGRSYMLLGDTVNAAACADKAIEYINTAFGSVEKYLGFKRMTPLRACRISGLHLYKGNKDEALKLLDMTDNCLRCSHCVHSECADKIDRLGLYAELDGDYEKAIEYYQLGIKLGGNDIERTTGIRECRRKLNKQ